MKWNTFTAQKGRKIMYLLIPVIVGASITLQGALSNKISQNIGFIETVVLVHLFGLIASLVVYFTLGNSVTGIIKNVNLIAVFAGSLGLVIVFGFTKSISLNGVLTTVLISVLVQMILSKVIDHFGLFGVEQNPITGLQILSIVMMITAVFIYQRQ